MPGVSGVVLLTLARDVYAYLHDDAVRRVLDDGLASALDDGHDDGSAVVVAHSLGSVVAYSALSTALSAGLSAGLSARRARVATCPCCHAGLAAGDPGRPGRRAGAGPR